MFSWLKCNTVKSVQSFKRLFPQLGMLRAKQARTQGGCIPPPDLKRCWHDAIFHWKSSPKYFCTAHYSL